MVFTNLLSHNLASGDIFNRGQIPDCALINQPTERVYEKYRMKREKCLN